MRSGKGGINGLAEKIGLKSQWSLTFEVRKRLAVAAHLLGRVFESQWSLTFEVRKRGSRFLWSLTTSITRVCERRPAGACVKGCSFSVSGVKPALTRVRALPRGLVGTGALAW